MAEQLRNPGWNLHLFTFTGNGVKKRGAGT